MIGGMEWMCGSGMDVEKEGQKVPSCGGHKVLWPVPPTDWWWPTRDCDDANRYRAGDHQSRPKNRMLTLWFPPLRPRPRPRLRLRPSSKCSSHEIRIRRAKFVSCSISISALGQQQHFLTSTISWFSDHKCEFLIRGRAWWRGGGRNIVSDIMSWLYLDWSVIDDRFLRDEGEFLVVVLIRRQQLVFDGIETDRLESPRGMG